MSRRGLGWTLIALGVVLTAAGLFALLGSDTTPDVATSPTTVAEAEDDTTTTEASTTTEAPASTTTSSTLATTTTIRTETVEEFIAAFSAAVETDDEDFLFERLHPVVVEIYGAEVCRDWIASEIVTLGDYRLTGAPDNPEPRTMQTPQGEREVEVISAPVSFSFQGQTFEASAGLSSVDGVLHWLGECR